MDEQPATGPYPLEPYVACIGWQQEQPQPKM